MTKVRDSGLGPGKSVKYFYLSQGCSPLRHYWARMLLAWFRLHSRSRSEKLGARAARQRPQEAACCVLSESSARDECT